MITGCRVGAAGGAAARGDAKGDVACKARRKYNMLPRGNWQLLCLSAPRVVGEGPVVWRCTAGRVGHLHPGPSHLQ
eukprot:6787786-Pyramimonas_sp.AAC.1